MLPAVQPCIYHRFRDILSQMILTLTFDPSEQSKVKFHGANRKPTGTFLYDLCWVQHRISHRLATNHACDHPPNQRHSYNVCRNRSIMQYYVLQPGDKNDWWLVGSQLSVDCRNVQSTLRSLAKFCSRRLQSIVHSWVTMNTDNYRVIESL